MRVMLEKYMDDQKTTGELTYDTCPEAYVTIDPFSIESCKVWKSGRTFWRRGAFEY